MGVKARAKITLMSPIFSYFYFLFNYLMKKKSTWIIPLLFYSVLISLFVINRIMLNTWGFELTSPTTTLILFPFILSTSIIFFGVYGIIKGINLFKDPANEGIEILIVSKPIERWQIILTRFLMFFILGIILTILTILVSVIGASISSWKLVNDFGWKTVIFGGPLSGFVSFTFFGIFSILLSLKLSTKSITSIGIGLIVGGLIVNNVAQVQELYSTRYSQVQREIDKKRSMKIKSYYDNETKQTKYYLSPNYSYSRYDGTLSNLSLTPNEFYNPETLLQINNLWDGAQDNIWVYTLNNFINPISAFNQLTSFSPPKSITQSRYSENDFSINELNFKFKITKNSNINKKSDKNDKGYNYFIDPTINLSIKNQLKEGFILQDNNENRLYKFELIKQNQEQGDYSTLKSSNKLDEFYLDKKNINKISELIKKLNNIEQSLWEQEIRNWIQEFEFLELEKIFRVYKKDSLIPHDPNNGKWDNEIKAVFIFQMIYLFVLNDVMNSNVEIESLKTSGLKLYKEIANIKEVKFNGQDKYQDQYLITGDNLFLNHNFIYSWNSNRIEPTNFFKVKKQEFQIINIENIGERTPIWSLWIIWIVLISSISGIAIWVYLRKDFK